MRKDVKKLKITVRFDGAEGIGKDQEQEMWAQFFGVIKLFEKENVDISKNDRLKEKMIKTHLTPLSSN